MVRPTRRLSAWPSVADGDSGAALVPPVAASAAPALVVSRLHPTGVVLDSPLTGPPGTRVYAATNWRDSMADSGWLSSAWDFGPGGRGFIPGMIEPGDVVTFGAFRPPPTEPGDDGEPGQARYQLAAEWIGYLYEITAGSLRFVGPYPDRAAAYAAAQNYLLTRELPADLTGKPVLPAQPPATLSITWHGPTAIIGDPRHGWLTVETGRLAAALTLTGDDLRRQLRGQISGLTGDESTITLAALAATHLADLPDVTTRPAVTNPGSAVTEVPGLSPTPPSPAPSSPAGPLLDADGDPLPTPDPTGSQHEPAPEPAGVETLDQPRGPQDPGAGLDGA